MKATEQVVTATLTIDCGDGHALKGDPGRFRYTRQPTAEYRCYRCHTLEGPVTGADVVRRFAQTIRTTHGANCPANQGEKAA